MILYSKDLLPSFIEYGIEIPIFDIRASECFKRLKVKSKFFDTTNILTYDDLLLCHTEEYVNKLKTNPEREILSSYELIDDEGNYLRYNKENAVRSLDDFVAAKLREASATYQAMKYSLEDGFCFNFGGGMHHAMSFKGGGFCLINDIVIGIKKLQQSKKIKTAWVIDVDAHKGDGTSEITYQDNDILTLSIHMKHGWPLDSDTNTGSYFPSNIDIELNENEEHLYNQKLLEGLNELAESFIPDLVVIVDGADPWEHDELASASYLKMTKKQLLERDMLLYNFFKDKKIPQTYLMAGGYSKKSYEIYLQFLKVILREVRPSF